MAKSGPNDISVENNATPGSFLLDSKTKQWVTDGNGDALTIKLHMPEKVATFLNPGGKLRAPWASVRDRARFVLTPSYRQKSLADNCNVEWVDRIVDDNAAVQLESFPDQCRLDYDSALDEGDLATIQVIIVRKEHFEAYRAVWGGTCVILMLPNQLQYSDGVRMHHAKASKRTYTAKDGGVGFARLVGQLWAYHAGIEVAHFWDDNVISCSELICMPDGKWGTQTVNFSYVLREMEAVMRACLEPDTYSWPEKKKDLGRQNFKPDSNKVHESVRGKLAVLGMGRSGERYQNKVNPFSVTPVYSAFMLNVKLTVEAGALFPCKRIWEDVEYAYIVENTAGLKMIKCQRLYHAKPFSRKAKRGVKTLPATEDCRLFDWTESDQLMLADKDGSNNPTGPLSSLESLVRLLKQLSYDLYVYVTSRTGCPAALVRAQKIPIWTESWRLPAEPGLAVIICPDNEQDKRLGVGEFVQLMRDYCSEPAISSASSVQAVLAVTFAAMDFHSDQLGPKWLEPLPMQSMARCLPANFQLQVKTTVDLDEQGKIFINELDIEPSGGALVFVLTKK